MKFYFIFFFFFVQDYTEIGNGWLKLYLFAANHLYLVAKEYVFIIPMYYEKKNPNNNQNSFERAILMNTHGIYLYRAEESQYIYNQIPTFFSFSENPVGQNKSHQFILICVIFPFLSNALSFV